MAFERKHKEELPVLAICYDFDKTLSPDDMQAQGYIQSVGYDVGQFWKESNGMAQDNDMDGNLAYMYKMKPKATSFSIKMLSLSMAPKFSYFPAFLNGLNASEHTAKSTM